MEEHESKIYIAVDARIEKTGRMRPLKIIWDDGRSFHVQRVVDVSQAGSLKTGGAGIRYRCIISGRELYLHFDGARWYVERRTV